MKRSRRKPERKLTAWQKRQLKIARDTLKMSDAMVGVMGDMDKGEAKRIIRHLMTNDV